MLKLITITEKESCLACFEETGDRVTCCNTAICKDCYLKWLQQKRQCMHCKEDQCDFDVWVENYRVEEDFDPQEYLHSLIEHQDGFVGFNPITMQAPGFGIEDMITAIQHQLGQETNPFTLMDPGDLPSPDEPFTFEFGFVLAPTDPDGNPVGPGVTVTQNLDYNGRGDEQVYEQIRNAMGRYQRIFSQMNSPPSDSEDLEDQWDDQPPNCIQQ